jgi:hypothetical protein
MLADEHELPITLMYQNGGFTFVLKKTTSVGELPKDFINVSSRKGKWLFSNMELVCYFLNRSPHSTTDVAFMCSAEKVKRQDERRS